MSSSPVVIDTPRLLLVLNSTESVLASIEKMSPEDQAEVSPDWLARVRSSPPSPWTHGFGVVERETNSVIGYSAFKGPPDANGVVEIAYGIAPTHRGHGYAKETASALTDFALGAGARHVIAHTRQENNASTRVLKHCGFAYVGAVVDPEDGPVWRWEFVAMDGRDRPDSRAAGRNPT